MADKNEQQQRIEERDRLLESMDFEDFFATRIENAAKHFTMSAHNLETAVVSPAMPKDIPALGAYLAYKVTKRQEQILIQQHTVLTRMEKQSETMTKHSKAMIVLTVVMIVLTVVILAAMGLQIYLQWFNG